MNVKARFQQVGRWTFSLENALPKAWRFVVALLRQELQRLEVDVAHTIALLEERISFWANESHTLIESIEAQKVAHYREREALGEKLERADLEIAELIAARVAALRKLRSERARAEWLGSQLQDRLTACRRLRKERDQLKSERDRCRRERDRNKQHYDYQLESSRRLREILRQHRICQWCGEKCDEDGRFTGACTCEEIPF